MAAAVGLKSLKEQKLPRYTKGTPWDEYYIKLLSAAKTRGRAAEAITGKFKGKMTVAEGGGLSDEQKNMQDENDRAWSDLISVMPPGRLIKIVSNAKSTDFPEGCVYTAVEEIKAKLYKITSGNRRQLKAAFETDFKFPKNSNPARYMDKLIDMQLELQTKYNCIKTDEDIIDQILKVLAKDPIYAYTINSIKKDRRNERDIDLKNVQEELKEIYEDNKLNKKASKKINLSDDSSDGSDEKEEEEEALMSYGAMQNQLFFDKKTNKHYAFVAVEDKQQYNYSYNQGKQFKGMCYQCGKWGHKGAECPEKKTRGRKR